MAQNAHIDGIYASWVKKVVGLVGDERLLADALNVSVTELRRWANGEEVPPFAAFAKVVSIGSKRAAPAPGAGTLSGVSRHERVRAGV
jgi:hypothetical protein